jgi:alpha-D-xyloside xylohydrolase
MKWNDATGTLSVGRREGSFPEMLKEREIRVVLVSKDKAVGFSFDAAAVKSVHMRAKRGREGAVEKFAL